MTETAMALSRALEARDLETRVHCDVVGALARGISHALGHQTLHAERVGIAGRLHDVGKLAIPDHILFKPTTLTAREKTVMETHATHGAHILRGAGLYDEARWVLHHHERIDGTGYPYRLSGDDIPLESRIIFVCDAFDAMTSDRPYATAQPIDAAFRALAASSGTQFDPVCVEALRDVYLELQAA